MHLIMTKLTPVITATSATPMETDAPTFNLHRSLPCGDFREARRAEAYKQRGFFALPQKPIKQAVSPSCWDFLKCLKR